jgi:hypothetical protein
LGVRSRTDAPFALLLLTALAWDTPTIAQPDVEPQRCTAKTAKTVSFKKAGELASDASEVCIRIKGFVYSGALHRSKAIALSRDEYGWQTMGLSGNETEDAVTDERLNQMTPRRATIIGYLQDCGSKNWPQYCHYVGGPIIRVQQITFAKP